MLHQAWLALQVALTWYFGLSVCAALLFLAARPLAPGWIRSADGAGAALTLRLLPATLSVGTVIALVLPAFAWLEPFGRAARGERLGLTALLLASGGAALLALSVCRGGRAVVLTRRRMRALHGEAVRATGLTSAAPIFVSESPVACVVLDGLVRPRLFVSRSVVERLTREELDRAVAHELAHHRAYDNIKRRLLAFAPDLVSGSRLARELETAWKHGAELRADVAASRGSETQAVALASALIKVARLAEGRPQVDLGRAAFHDGAPVAERIRILCTRTTNPLAGGGKVRGLLLGAAVTAMLLAAIPNASSVLPAVHRVTEFLVRLP
jgi:Zn-dependent protease with chaperone function